MNIMLKNLGAIKQADFSLGNLTILCGNNNTGKTYVTYALFGFLSSWKENFPIDISDSVINSLLSEGTLQINTDDYIRDADEIMSKGCKEYIEQLPMVFAAPDKDRFKDTEFLITFDPNDIHSKNLSQ